MKNLSLYLLAFLWLFGPLLLWPLFRYALKMKTQMVTCLKWFFWLQVIGLFLSFGFVYYLHMADYRDVHHAFIVPYGVGSLFWVLTLIILLFGLVSTLIEKMRKT